MHLILSEVDRPERKREIKTFPCLIGKAEDCGFRLHDKRLSDHHAVILLDGDRLRLIDLSSRNGTYVLQPESGDRGKPEACPAVRSTDGIPPSVRCSAPELRDGTTVAFGGLLYSCEIRQAPDKPQPEGGVGDGPMPSREHNPRSDLKTHVRTGFRIAIKDGTENGRTIFVEQQSTILGSDRGIADIVFPSNLVSRRHARLSCNKNGQVVIEDLQSKNGTYVQGKRIAQPVVLKPGVEVSLGHGPVFYVGDQIARVHSRLERAVLAGLVGCIIVAVGVVVMRSGPDETPHDAGQGSREIGTETTDLETSIAPDRSDSSPAPSLSGSQQALQSVQRRLASSDSWDKEQLVAIQNQLRSVSEPALEDRKAAFVDMIRRRMLSLQALERAHAAVRAGDWETALRSFEEAEAQDTANPWAANGMALIREMRPLLSRVAVEAGYDAPDESRLGGLVQEVVQQVAAGPLLDALHGYLESKLGAIASAHFLRAERFRNQGKAVDALMAVRRGLNLMPWDEHGMQMIPALEKDGKPELESLLIRAYQLESNHDADSREQAAAMYRKIMDVCLPSDWTASFREKARHRVE